MGRCNPITKTCTRAPWWLSAMGIDWIGSGGGGEEPGTGVEWQWEDEGNLQWEDDSTIDTEET